MQNIHKGYINFKLNKKNKSFFNFITGLDKHNIHSILKNKIDWFGFEEGRKMTESIIDTYYEGPIKVDNKGQIIFRAKLNDDVVIYNSYKEKIDKSVIKINDKIRLVLHFVGLKFFKRQAIPVFEIKQFKHISLKPKKKFNIDT